MHGKMLSLQLERLRLLDEQIAKLNSLIAQQGIESKPKLLIYRAQYLAKQLRKFGYNVHITPAGSAPE